MKASQMMTKTFYADP